MRINSNLAAINTHRLSGLNTVAAKTMERLSGGLRINRAGDDAAGLAASEKMRGQIRGLNMASRNASDSISMIQTAEGALGQTHEILQRMRELAVQASNGIYSDDDRRHLQAEMGQLQSEIDRIGNTTEFNTRPLLDGSASQTATGDSTGSITAQIGANSGQTASVSIGDMRADALGIAGLNITTASGASTALEAIDSAIQSVSSQRSQLGAAQNRFEHTVKNLNTAAENQQAAESRIRDADMARVAMQQTTNGILRQTTFAMVAQANMAQQSVLRLLG
jgi:flagellin